MTKKRQNKATFRLVTRKIDEEKRVIRKKKALVSQPTLYLS